MPKHRLDPGTPDGTRLTRPRGRVNQKGRCDVAKFKPKKTAKPKGEKKKKPKKPRTGTGQRSNAWRAYVGGGSNEPIPW